MGADTKIEWAHHTFNPWVGCTKVSPACDRCYAEAWAKRTGHPALWQGERRRTSAANWKLPLKWNKASFAAGERHSVFCASLADWLDNQAEAQWREDLAVLIDETPNLDWLLLSKRLQNWSKLAPWHDDDIPKNVWLGTTVENQEEADRRIPALLQIPAPVRFLSCEPLLGPLDLSRWMPSGRFFNAICEHCGHTGSTEHFDLARGHDDADVVCPKCHRTILANEIGTIDWVIAGGESGPGARPMHPGWARALRDQCAAAGVPFFFKQFGEFAPSSALPIEERVNREEATVLPDGRVRQWQDDYPEARLTAPDMASMRRVGKKRAGRLLDGREHNEFPR